MSESPPLIFVGNGIRKNDQKIYLLVKLFIRQSETKVLYDTTQLMLLYLAISIIIKQSQCFQHTLELASHLKATPTTTINTYKYTLVLSL